MCDRIPGTYGDFKCESTTGKSNCNVQYMGMSESGDFTFDFGADPNVLQKAGLPNSVDRSKVQTKNRSRREFGW